MNIYIAKDFNCNVHGLIVATTKEVANAYFEGKYGIINSVEEIKMEDLENRGRSFFTILETTEESYQELNYPNKRITIRRLEKRGG